MTIKKQINEVKELIQIAEMALTDFIDNMNNPEMNYDAEDLAIRAETVAREEANLEEMELRLHDLLEYDALCRDNMRG